MTFGNFPSVAKRIYATSLILRELEHWAETVGLHIKIL